MSLLSGCSGKASSLQTASVPWDLSTAWVSIPDNPQFDSYVEVGTVELRIRDFYPRRLVRDVSIQPRGGGKTQQPKQNFPNRKTVWDIDALSLCTGSVRQKVKIDIIIRTDKNVHFQTVEVGGRPGSPIGAASSTDAAAFSNATLPQEISTGVWKASFWLLCEAGTTDRFSKFNIALDVKDADNVGYSLPLIVDPSIRNRG
jgi:hypothetical protein